MSNFINKTLESKTVFITGATFGIGEATAKYFASIGLNVIIFGRSVENGKRVEKEINDLGVGKALFTQGDVTSEEDQKRALEEGEKKFGAIHYAYANAGVLNGFGKLLETSLKELKNVIDINFYGSFITLQQVAPYFKKNGGGVIVFCSSTISLIPRKFFVQNDILSSAYFLSKVAVDGLVKTATSLNKSHNIKAYAINPTVYISGMSNNEQAKPEVLAQSYNLLFKKYGEPRDLARVLEHLFDGTTKYLNGQGIVCENEYTISAQFFYDLYSGEEDVDAKKLLHFHLRDSKGEKLDEKQIQQAELKINKITEEINLSKNNKIN